MSIRLFAGLRTPSPSQARRRLVAILLLSALSAQDSPDSVRRGVKQFDKKVIVSGLSGPWELAWGPDNRLWVTERTGKRVTRVDPSTGVARVAITIDEVSAPGGQDGLLGMALHPELLKGTGQDYVYVAYTYVDKQRGPDASVTDPASPYRYLYGKIARLQYDAATQTLSAPVDILTGLPVGDDHNGGRLKISPQGKLHLTTGDQGHNQFGNFCLPIESQRLPTSKEVQAGDYSAYVGKTLRINLDGSIPADNPKLAGVVSHVYTYGHRNPQGLDIGVNGVLYSSEHGPRTDDEVNVLSPGSNYGWPHVAGLLDDKAYRYARWAEARTPCRQLKYNDSAIPPSVPQDEESAFRQPFANPLATMFTVASGFSFSNPACKGVEFVCWPTVGVSSVEYYQANGTGIPGWDHVLLVPTLKRGSLYVLPLQRDGKAPAGAFWRYFQSENRFRDTAVSPDGRTIYIATDPGGVVGAQDAGVASKMEHPGAILAFRYVGEGTPAVVTETPRISPSQTPASTNAPQILGAIKPRFTAAQAAAGKKVYDARCAVCHGTTLQNGAYGTPLAGEHFKSKWTHRSVGALYEKSKTTMPPSSPASLPPATYADIVAYLLQANGYKAGPTSLRPGDPSLEKMALE